MVSFIFILIILSGAYLFVGLMVLMAAMDSGLNTNVTTYCVLTVVFWPIAVVIGIGIIIGEILKWLKELTLIIRKEVVDDDVLKINKFFKDEKEKEE